ncbi:MAG: ATP-binding cassette domain-containing protein [Myxococcota bacterium]
MAVIEVEDLQRTFGALVALAGVSFRVDRGEIVGLLGPNGAGKTTTRRILTGLLAPTGGVARVDGRDVLADLIAVKARVGYLAEGAPLYDEMAAGRLLQFVAKARGLGPAERARAVEQVAHAVDIADRLGPRIGTLSRGYRQRVGLAAALVHDPPILVLDEPTTGLDPNQVAELRALIRRLGATRTVILSTHVLSEVQATADRVLILHRGRLVADDRVERVVASTRGQVLHVGIGAGKVQARSEALLAELRAVPGVRAVRPATPLDEAHRFEVEAEGDARADVFRWAVDRGHVLVELSAAHRNLEDVFRHLTDAESPDDPA